MWSLSEDQRKSIASRAASNMSAMALVRGVTITAEDALVAAAYIERKAYTTAEVASNTTTGSRPASESIETYARC